MKKKLVSKLMIAAVSASMLVTAVPVYAVESDPDSIIVEPVESDAELETPVDPAETVADQEEPVALPTEEPIAEPTPEAVEEVVDTDKDADAEAEQESAESQQEDEEIEESVAESENQEPVTITYSALVDGAWQSPISSGTAGTVGAAKEIRGISVDLVRPNDEDIHVNYQTYVGNSWSAAVADGAQSGNGKVQAIQIWLSGKDAADYQISYRAHVQNLGWKAWTASGAAGTIDFDYRLEGFEIVLNKIDPKNPLVGAGADSNAVLINPGVSYRVHQENYGWMGAVANGASAGVTGRALRMEAFTANISNASAGVGIRYRTHVQNYGWMNWVYNGQVGGTTGKALRMEAIQMELTGANASKYDIYYALHIQNAGWLNWAKNGAEAGSSGAALRVEAIAIKILPKGSAAPASLGTYLSYINAPTLTYQVHVQDYGWQGTVSAGNTAGTTGKSKRLEGIYINLGGSTLSGGINYRTHIQNIGWESSYRGSGQFSGTQGRALRLEAIQISLTGQLASYFDVYYRVHAQNFGWMGWAKNGASAGTAGYAYRLEGIQIKLVGKGQAAPGSTANAFRQLSNDFASLANRYSSATNYLILTNKAQHKVTVFSGSRGNWRAIREMSCTVGAPGMNTPSGEFSVGSKPYYFNSGNVRCFYATQIWGDYLFHSVLYNQSSTIPTPNNIVDGRLGQDLSHGCVRLATEDAKWLQGTVPAGTKIVIY